MADDLPATLDIGIYRGDTFLKTLRFWTDSTKSAGLDVSDRTFTAQAREHASDNAVIDITVDASAAHPASPSDPGVIVLSIDPAVTSVIDWNVGVWDMQEVVGSDVTTLIAGSVVVSGDVTR